MPNILIVSNRLPVSVKRNDNGQLELHPSSGGLATALSSYTKKRGSLWIGWPGLASEDLTDKEKLWIIKELHKLRCHPIFLTRRQLNGFYNGYSNSVLWPVLHHMPAEFTDSPKLFRTYTEVNRRFADAVQSTSSPRTKIWVHDYQLLLLPQLLRKRLPNNQIGFFLHIPFTSSKEFNRIPEARKLLIGILGASLVGFHTKDYSQNFLACCQAEKLGTIANSQVILEDRTIRVSDFPIGIDYSKFAEASSSRVVKKKARGLQRQVRGAKIILTVDRLEPSKGFIERLKAYKELLKQNPHLHGKVVMIMLAVPSRTEIPAYQKLKRDVETLVASINRLFGTPRWEPIRYLFTSLPFEDLSALYAAADVAFVSPLRDGMNLVAKEYVASKRQHRGVLILSETAGAAQELQDALLVNPHKIRSLVDALTISLTMPKHELRYRLKRMQEHLSAHTVQHWAQNFMGALTEPHSLRPPRIKLLTPRTKKHMIATFHHASRRLFILDYDGTLVPFAATPSEAVPPRSLRNLLQRLSQLDGTDVVINSGRPQETLEAWFGRLPITLVAEHGAAIRKTNKPWEITESVSAEWKEVIRPIMEASARLAPGAFVEEKPHSLVWHYRDTLPYHAHKNLLLLRQRLGPHAKSNGLQMEAGSKILEVRSRHINKGVALQKLSKQPYDFVIAIGDDKTDEAMFKAAPKHAFTIKVRLGRTHASYWLPSPDSVRKLLNGFTKI